VYVAFVLASGATNLSVAVNTLSPGRLLLVVSFILLGLALRALRWCYFLRSLGIALPFLPSIIAFLASFSLTATPGKAGELIKSVLLRTRYDVPMTKTASILLVERLGDLAAIVCLAIFGLSFFQDLQLYVAISVALIGMAYVCFYGSPAINGLLLSIARKLGKGMGKVTEMQSALSRLSKPSTFFVGLVAALAAWSCEALAFFVLTLPADLPMRASVSIFALSSIAGALSMLPGGLGGFEAAMVVLLLRAGVDSAMAVTLVATFRLCTLYLVTLLGIGSLVVWQLSSAPAESGAVQ
jgi:uncharacterized protein (TIRG00374 family)